MILTFFGRVRQVPRPETSTIVSLGRAYQELGQQAAAMTEYDRWVSSCSMVVLLYGAECRISFKVCSGCARACEMS